MASTQNTQSVAPGASLEQLIAVCLMTPRHDPTKPTCIWGLPLNIVGLSGGGKSERVAAACKALGLPLQTVFPASKQPEDFGGAPFATPDGIVIECILPQANALINAPGGQGVLFFDELSTARPAVQASALGVFNDRRVGDHLLPPKARTLAAMNPPEYAAGGFVLEGPLANRMMHVRYDMPTTDEWTDWLTGHAKLHLDKVQNAELTVLQNWNQHWSKLSGMLAGFVRANPTMLHKQPDPGDSASGGPWPSPRMWNWAGRAIATSRCMNMPKELENEIVQGCVGDTVLREWIEWVAKADLPDPLDMLNKGWIPDPDRLDIVIAALTSLVTWVTKLKKGVDQTKYAAGTWDLLKPVIEMGSPDLAVRPATILIESDLANTSRDATLKQAAKSIILELGREGLSQFARMEV